MEGKVVAITGASSGIGEAIATFLAARGAYVVLGARRTDLMKELTSVIHAGGGKAVYMQTDVTRRGDLTKLVAFAVEQFGRLDVMINNAGISQLSPIEELDIEGWEQMINVNLKGMLYGTAAAMPVFRSQGSGHFINIISTAGISIVPTMGVYAGTKNAVRTISESLRQESKGRWRVTGISPGFVQTPFAENIKNEALKKIIIEKANEIAIPADAIAQAVAYAIEQPDNVDVGDIVIRPTVQD